MIISVVNKVEVVTVESLTQNHRNCRTFCVFSQGKWLPKVCDSMGPFVVCLSLLTSCLLVLHENSLCIFNTFHFPCFQYSRYKLKSWKRLETNASAVFTYDFGFRGVVCSLAKNFPNNAFKKCISFKRSQQGNQVLFCGFAGTIAKCCDLLN